MTKKKFISMHFPFYDLKTHYFDENNIQNKAHMLNNRIGKKFNV